MGQQGQGKPQKGQGEGQQDEGESGQGEQSDGQKGEGQKGGGKQSGDGESQSGDNGKRQGGKNGDGKRGKGAQGQGNGQNGEGQGKGQGSMSESELQEIYEIYKEQQVIRQRLEQQLQNMINAGDKQLGQKLLKQMEDFENDLLENGVTQRSISKVNNIQYELLKLENAALKQGQKLERESNTNKLDFKNPILSKPDALKNYRNEIEILNRETLPLRPNFRNRVKDYFKSDD